MTKHTIGLAVIHGYQTSVTFASSVGSGEHKHLDAEVTFTADGPIAIYVVRSHHRVIYQGHSLADAVAAYNEA